MFFSPKGRIESQSLALEELPDVPSADLCFGLDRLIPHPSEVGPPLVPVISGRRGGHVEGREGPEG